MMTIYFSVHTFVRYIVNYRALPVLS